MATRNTTHVLKNSDIVNRPLPGSLFKGEPIINTADGILYFSGVTTSTSEWTAAGTGTTANFFEVGSNLYDLKLRNQITKYQGTSGSGLIGKFLSGTSTGFVLADISEINGISGFTYNPSTNTFTITDASGDVYDATIQSVTGLTVNGTLSATTVNGNTVNINNLTVTGSATYNQTATSPNDIVNYSTLTSYTQTTDVYVTGSTYSGSVDSSNSTTHTLSYHATPSGGPYTLTGEDTYTTGGTYDNNTTTITFKRNDGTSGYTVDLSTIDVNDTYVSGGTVTSGGTLDLFRTDNVTVSVPGVTYWTSGTTGTTSIKAINTTGLDSTGDRSVAWGNQTLASGNDSTAWGVQTSATTIGSTSQGLLTLASGDYSHAEGTGTIASGDNSHSEGYYTTAYGDSSHSEGGATQAFGNISHAEGDHTITFGNYSHSEGYYTKTGGNNGYLAISVAAGLVTLDGSYGDVSTDYPVGNNLYLNDRNYDDTYTTISRLIATSSFNGTETEILLVDTSITTTTAVVGNINLNPVNWIGDQVYGGDASHAEGSNTIALGFGSHAENYGSISVGMNSHAEGNTSIAIGDNSHAEGAGTQANGYGSHAEGQSTTAIGDYSHAEGTDTQAVGSHSHAEGKTAIANGNYSHAEGQQTTASGQSSHAEGISTQAIGNYSHAEGDGTTASGDYSHAEGQDTTASGSYSHAEGFTTTAIGNGTHAEGTSTIAGWRAFTVTSVVAGLITISDNVDYSSVFNSGEVILDNIRYTNNAVVFTSPNFTIQLDDTTVNSGTYVSDFTNLNSPLATNILGTGAHATGTGTKALGDFSETGGDTTLASGYGSHAEGNATQATGDASHAEGNTTIASGDHSHAEGYSTIASVSYSHAEGNQTTADGQYSHTEGFGSQTIGANSHAEGNSTIASGINSHAEGYGGETIGNSSHSEGYITTAYGDYSHSEGESTTSSGTSSHSEGSLTLASGDYSHAEGVLTKSIGVGSHSEGSGTTASGSYSHSEGVGTIASGDTSFIHSTNSVVGGDRSVVLGGQNITGLTNDTVYVPYLNLNYVPTLNNANTEILSRNSVGGQVEYTPLSAFTALDTYVTGFTYSPSTSTFTIKQNQGQSDLTALIDTMTGLTVTGDAVIEGSLTVFGPSVSAFTSNLYVEDSNITLNYNPTGSTTVTSIGAGWTIQDGSGISNTATTLNVGVSYLNGNLSPNTEYTSTTGNSNRNLYTQLGDIIIRNTNYDSNAPDGVRVLAEGDVLDGGLY